MLRKFHVNSEGLHAYKSAIYYIFQKYSFEPLLNGPNKCAPFYIDQV